MLDERAREISKQIIGYLEERIQADPPEPFVLAGRIMRDLSLNRNDFYMIMGRLIGFKVGEYQVGKNRFYYLLEMVHMYREAKK